VTAPVTNAGQVFAGLGTLDLAGSVSQVSGTTLTGGTWIVFGPATLEITSAPNLTTIGSGAVVELDEPNSVFSNLAGLNNVMGTLQLLFGATFSTTGDLMVSGSGILDLGSSCTLTTNGNFNLTANAALQTTVAGSNSTPLFGQLVVTGTVTLAGTLDFTITSMPAVGTSIELIDNQGSSAINGTFSNYAQGSTFQVLGMTLEASYFGGTGNDMTMSRIS
jgi:hypothetical protein